MRNNRQKQQGMRNVPFQHFHVKGNYVTQSITIQSGCNVYFTPDGGMPEKPKAEEPITTLYQEVPMSRFEQGLLFAVLKVLKDGLITHKQDFRAIHQMIVEMRYYDKFSLLDMLDLLKKVDGIPKHLMPSVSNLKCITFKKTHHPNWAVKGFGPNETQHIVSIGLAFRRYFEENLKSR